MGTTTSRKRRALLLREAIGAVAAVPKTAASKREVLAGALTPAYRKRRLRRSQSGVTTVTTKRKTFKNYAAQPLPGKGQIVSVGGYRTSERRILIVDDEPELLEELAESLAAGGWQVDSALNAISAWEKLASNQNITVVLTDIRMPGMDGLTLAKRVCETRKDALATEVVLLTGHGTLDDAAAAVRVGAFDFLTKPISLKSLLGATERAHKAATHRRAKEAARAAEIESLSAERIKLQQELERLGGQRDLTRNVPREFSNILSHEMRTPLVALMGVPELLTQGAELPASELADNMAIIRNAGARLTSIADDFVELLVPPDRQGLELRVTKPDLILLRVRAAANAEGHAVLGEDKAGGHLETDVTALVKLLGRLVDNAIAWSPPGGDVKVSSYAENAGEVCFEVADQGPGMTAAEIETARQPFRQLDMSLARRVGGLGLGLPLAEQMARLLGGRLRLLSEPGQGTRATVIIPREPQFENDDETIGRITGSKSSAISQSR